MKDPAILYVGSITPELSGDGTTIMSAAAELFQRSLLAAMAQVGLPPSAILTYVPIPPLGWTKGIPLFVFGRKARTADGQPCQTLGHINYGPLKILTLGINAALRTIAWAWRNRRVENRVLIVYNLAAPHSTLLLAACRLTGTKFVPQVCDIYVPGELVGNTPIRRLDFRLQSWAVGKADGLLVCNPAIVEDFAPGHSFLLMDGGVLTRFADRFSPRTEPREGLFRITMAAFLIEANGVDLLLGAMALLDDPDLRVTIVGRGSRAEAVAKAAEKDPRIVYPGPVSHDEVLNLYEDADLLLSLRGDSMRSDRYLFPSKIFECLATGRPLLAAPMGHLVSEFGDYVYVLEERTPEALAEKIRAIKATPVSERADLGRRAQAFIRENRTWEVNVHRIVSYLKTSVLGKSR